LDGSAVRRVGWRDRKLADSLAEGFQGVWRKAMRNVREIQVDPRGHAG
jgi:hypothetical protein